MDQYTSRTVLVLQRFGACRIPAAKFVAQQGAADRRMGIASGDRNDLGGLFQDGMKFCEQGQPMTNKSPDQHLTPASEPEVEQPGVQKIGESIAQYGWKRSTEFLIATIECVAEACAERELSVPDLKLFWMRMSEVVPIELALKTEGGDDDEMRRLRAAVETFDCCFRRRSDDEPDLSFPWSLTELMNWLEHLDQTRQLCEGSCRSWRARWTDITEDRRRPVLQCIEEIESRIPLLRSRHLSDMPAQWDAIEKCMLLTGSLVGYDGYIDGVMRFAEAIVHSRKKSALQEALIVSRWLQSSSPRAYLNLVTQRVYRDVTPDQSIDSQNLRHEPGQGGRIPERDVLGQPGVPLEKYLLTEEAETDGMRLSSVGSQPTRLPSCGERRRTIRDLRSM